MAAPMKRVVGWIDRLEWIHVYEELFSRDLVKQKHAVDRIAVWKSRSDKLSVAIECTWELMSAELYYHGVQEDLCLREQDKCARIISAMALTRFINLITEKGQNARYAFPVHQLTNDLCLPEWMVSLRHDAVHSNLPSMAVLRAGVQTALEWLQVEYWEAQLAEEDPVREERLVEGAQGTPVPDSETAEIFTKALEAYTGEYYMLFAEKGANITKADRQNLKTALNDMERLVASSNREVVVDVLLQDGFFLHTAEQLELFGVSVKDLLADDSLLLPAQLLPMWRPVLKMLRSGHHLLTQLLLIQDGPDLRLRQAAGWVAEMLAVEINGSEGRMSLLSKTFTQEDLVTLTRGRHLLVTSLNHPNRYTAALMPHVFQTVKPELSEMTKRMLMKTVQMYTDMASTGEPATHLESGKAGNTEPTQIHDVDSLDIVVKPMEWSDCPLGYCPNMPVTYTSLELPEAVNSLGGAPPHPPRATHHTPLLTPSREKCARAHTGKDNQKYREDPETTHNANMELSLAELDVIKGQIALF